LSAFYRKLFNVYFLSFFSLYTYEGLVEIVFLKKQKIACIENIWPGPQYNQAACIF